MLLSESRENQLKYRKIKLAIVFIVCALAIIQIVCACAIGVIDVFVEAKTLNDYYKFLEDRGHDWFADNDIGKFARTNFFAGFWLHIIVPIIVIIAITLLYVKKKRQIFFLPLLQVAPALLLEMEQLSIGLSIRIPSIWVITNKYALSVGIISTALLLFYDILPLLSPMLEKVVGKSEKIVKNTQDTVQQKKRARAIKNIAEMERLIEEEIARTGKTREELLEEALKQKK